MYVCICVCVRAFECEYSVQLQVRTPSAQCPTIIIFRPSPTADTLKELNEQIINSMLLVLIETTQFNIKRYSKVEFSWGKMQILCYHFVCAAVPLEFV